MLPTLWPTKSPDLNPVDYKIWSLVSDAGDGLRGQEQRWAVLAHRWSMGWGLSAHHWHSNM